MNRCSIIFIILGCQLKVQIKIFFRNNVIFPLHTIFPLSCHTFHTSFTTIDSALCATLPTPSPRNQKIPKIQKFTFCNRFFGNFILCATAAVKLRSQILCVDIHFLFFMIWKKISVIILSRKKSGELCDARPF